MEDNSAYGLARDLVSNKEFVAVTEMIVDAELNALYKEMRRAVSAHEWYAAASIEGRIRATELTLSLYKRFAERHKLPIR